MDHDPLALRQRGYAGVEHVREAGDVDRHLGLGVAQREEHQSSTGASGELRDLPFHPDGAEPGDVLLDEPRDGAHGGGRLRGRVQGHARSVGPRSESARGRARRAAPTMDL